MNIGILTVPFNVNYGGLLQAYALQTALEQMGHQASHINRLPHHYLPPLLRPVAYAKRLFEQKVQGRSKRILFEDYQNAIAQNTNQFVERYIHLGAATVDDVQPGQYDALVVGSDQIWRKGYLPDMRQAFLGFASQWDVRRVAYAASFGLDTWQYGDRLTRDCAGLLARFDAVSVREASAVQLCRDRLGCQPVVMPDPTLLLERADYARLIPPSAPTNDGELFVYMLGRNATCDDLTASIAQLAGMKAYRIVASDDDVNQPVSECVRPHVETWLKGFADAKLVVTNSFHGCVFSILFGKPFVVIGKREAGVTRIDSLLSQFGFRHAIVDERLRSVSQLDVHDAAAPHVEATLRQLRKQGYDFLRAALG